MIEVVVTDTSRKATKDGADIWAELKVLMAEIDELNQVADKILTCMIIKKPCPARAPRNFEITLIAIPAITVVSMNRCSKDHLYISHRQLLSKVIGNETL